MTTASCIDCKHYRTDDQGYPWCGKTSYWIGVKDRAYCCVSFEVE